MSDQQFFERPILNSPYLYPEQHWELDGSGQPTHKVINNRRPVSFITPIPKPKKQKKGTADAEALTFLFDDTSEAISDDNQQYESSKLINAIRQQVEKWRMIPKPSDWKVTHETQRLLQHWRHHEFNGIRPFFCQVEAVETAIWLTEVAPQMGKVGKDFLEKIEQASTDANPNILRIALKLATGAGKTTVMAMLIAWQTLNAVRNPRSRKFTSGFLLIAPGITIRDRLRVLLPNDSESYYKSRELIPADMLEDINRAKIVITNYHAFKLRERVELSKGGRLLLQGRGGEDLQTLETEGQMIQRVMPELMGMKNILVINDEAHHCYREKPQTEDNIALKGDEKKEAENNNLAARLWISGIEALQRQLGVQRVFDLSATPFFLKGSGYAEGTLFPWTVSDFSLMDAIECGIVKLPRVPVADNIPGGDVPKFRNLWEHIGRKMPKKQRGAAFVDPLKIPTELQTALEALYGHYKKVYEIWEEEGISVPPCFIVVCNNTSTSKLVYDYISGFRRPGENGGFEQGRLELFRNFDENGNEIPRPRTLLIDSAQLESGEALDKNFKNVAAEEVESFRREMIERGEHEKAKNISDSDILREVMNTVGKKGKLGESIRCVVSVSMLTEGWDANTVTHVLGVRAFGTQLLCEQVIGRALRRQSYDLNEEGLFNVEYADVLGIPFDFNAEPVIPKPAKPRETIHVKAVRPARDHLEIRFPRVTGYRVELPEEKIDASFNDDSILELTPDLVGPSITKNSGIIGEDNDLTLKHLEDMRTSSLIMHVTSHLLSKNWREDGGEFPAHHFLKLKKIVKKWLKECLVCKGGTYPAQLMYLELRDMACERIAAAITRTLSDEKSIIAVPDSYNPVGSTEHVNFTTSKTDRWETSPNHCHVNWVILDSDWEAEFCRVAESHPRVVSYVKNHSLGFEVPYRFGSEMRNYRPDFIVNIDDGNGEEDLLHLVVEIKGYRGEDAKNKKNTMDSYWVPGINNLKRYGRWAFAEFTDVYMMDHEFEKKIEAFFDRVTGMSVEK